MNKILKFLTFSILMKPTWPRIATPEYLFPLESNLTRKTTNLEEDVRYRTQTIMTNLLNESLTVPCHKRLQDLKPIEKTPRVHTTITKKNLYSKVKQGSKLKCINGKIQNEYPCDHVNLLSLLDNSALNEAFDLENDSEMYLNDIWGWRSLEGREFAIVGMVRGTAFVEITNPVNPIYLGVLLARRNFDRS